MSQMSFSDFEYASKRKQTQVRQCQHTVHPHI